MKNSLNIVKITMEITTQHKILKMAWYNWKKSLSKLMEMTLWHDGNDVMTWHVENDVMTWCNRSDMIYWKWHHDVI